MSVYKTTVESHFPRIIDHRRMFNWFKTFRSCYSPFAIRSTNLWDPEVFPCVQLFIVFGFCSFDSQTEDSASSGARIHSAHPWASPLRGATAFGLRVRKGHHGLFVEPPLALRAPRGFSVANTSDIFSSKSQPSFFGVVSQPWKAIGDPRQDAVPRKRRAEISRKKWLGLTILAVRPQNSI